MADMKVTISLCFDRLQNLQIKPTLGNMEILVQTLYDLREIYHELGEIENVRSESASAGTKDGTADNSEGRDND